MKARLGHGFPLGDTSGEFGIRFVADEGPAFLVARAGDVVVVEGGAVFDQRFGVFEIAVDGLDGGGDAIFLDTHTKETVSWLGLSGDMVRGGGKGTHLSDLLAQHLGLDDHALAVRRFPQRSRKNADVQLFHAYPHAQILQARTKEELVAEERLHDGR